jgi:hypothetical protein
LLNDPTTRRTVAPVAAIAGVTTGALVCLVSTRRPPVSVEELAAALALTKTSEHAEQKII